MDSAYDLQSENSQLYESQNGPPNEPWHGTFIQRQQHTFSHLDILTEKLSGSNDIALEKPGFVIFEFDYLFKPSIKNN